jgi:NAD(P)-dependent dehydrogenase (short-subunit alcohol dehydrogenase family)
VEKLATVPRSLVITGVSTGIGHATAKMAVSQNWRVFGSVRSDADAARLKEEFGAAFSPLILAVRDEAAITKAVHAVRASLGPRTLDGLVNNAGIGLAGPLLHQPLDEVRAVLDTNVFGTLLVSRAFVPLLGADQTLSGGKGRIVNMTSIAGKIGQPFAGAYAASKFAVEGPRGNAAGIQPLWYSRLIVAPATVDMPIWDEPESAIGRYATTDYGPAFDRGVRAIVDAGHLRSLHAKDIAEIVMKALTTRRPRLRYAPAQHHFLEQALPRMTPSRLTDFAIEQALALKPDVDRPLKGVSV